MAAVVLEGHKSNPYFLDGEEKRVIGLDSLLVFSQTKF